MTHEEKIKKISKWWLINTVRYTIYRNNERVETDIRNAKTALAHARKWQYDLFGNVRKVEILNQWTGEIVPLKEAEERYKKWLKSHKGAVNSGTT